MKSGHTRHMFPNQTHARSTQMGQLSYIFAWSEPIRTFIISVFIVIDCPIFTNILQRKIFFSRLFSSICWATKIVISLLRTCRAVIDHIRLIVVNKHDLAQLCPNKWLVIQCNYWWKAPQCQWFLSIYDIFYNVVAIELITYAELITFVIGTGLTLYSSAL